MQTCPVCKRALKDELVFCPFDGQALTPQTDKDRFIGIILEDKYRLEAKVGEGGMGKVYRATHIQMENTVAVKILHPHLSSDQMAVERFRREARAAAAIRHPNAVAVTDFGVTKDSGIAYLVMEFLEGGDLRDKLKQKRQLGYEDAYSILSQTCSALDAAHARGIIHRDLKPDNIWLLQTRSGTEHVKVLDFGIAKLKAGSDAINLTQKGMIVGTPYYMSPEQCRGEQLDAGSDIYSLGVILYEMLTGEVPFNGTSPLAVVLKHTTERARPLQELRPEIPKQVEDVVLRALEKRRADRPESAIQLSQEFEASLYKAGIQLKQLGTGTPQSGYAVRPFPADTAVGRAPGQSSGDFNAGTTAPTGGRDTDPTIAMDGERVTAQVGGRQTDATGGTKVIASETSPATERRATDVAGTRQKSKAKLYLLAGVLVLAVVAAIAYFATRPREAAPAEQQQAIKVAPPGMALIQAGTFLMGTNDPGAPPEWRPEHSVTVKDFYLDLYEVTNEEYHRFVRQKVYPAPPHWNDGTYPPGESKLPVYNVSWFDAKAYAEWAGKRLPTEAEWEYAARGTDGRIYPWGNEWSDELSNSGEDRRGKPVAVGSFSRGNSPFGIYDMAGNVAEWVADLFALYPGSEGRSAPGYRVYRGGSYAFPKAQLVTASRWTEIPTEKLPYIGFRCAKDVAQ